MAAIPHELAESNQRKSDDSRKGPLSHGRGGAGNMGTSKSDFDPVTLETPTLKGQVYTTGRGGSGNMAKNTDPEEARKAQDVTGHPRRESANNTHVGRGGAANVFKPSQEDIDAAKRANDDNAIADDKEDRKDGKGEKVKGLADKGKELLFGKKG